MRFYTLQVPPDRGEPVVLPEGFSWGAFFFGPFWFLWHGLWATGLLVFVLDYGLSFLLVAAGAPSVVVAVASLSLSILIGFNARDWWRLMLDRQRFTFAGVVQARSLDDAEWRLMMRAFAERARP